MVAGTMASAPNAQPKTKFSLTKPVLEQQDFGMEGTKRRDFAVNGEQQQLPKMSSSSSPRSSIKKLDCNRLMRLRVEEEPKDSPPKQECCMCGDVGFSTELFRCGRCLYRYQHTYCSRFYPSICDLDVCDWCSQGESNPSGSNNSKQSSRGAAKSSSKRKLLEAPAATPKRSSSNCSSQYTDALELLLEVAQTVADGKQTDGQDHEEQQQKQQEKVQKQQERQVEVFSSPKGKVGGNKVLDLQNITKRQSCEGDGRSSQFPKSSSSSNKLQHLSTSRSMGRRYKLLSDVLC